MTLARSWIGTPYRHQARKKHIGADCLGFLLGVWREASGDALPDPGPYSRDPQVADDSPLLAAAQSHLVACENDKMSPAQVLIFRINGRRPAQHCGLMSSSTHFLYAVERLGVVEAELTKAWSRRLVACFDLPFIKD